MLACLSRYQEQRTLEKADGQEEDAGRFTMVLDVNGETKQLVLGRSATAMGPTVEIPHPKQSRLNRIWEAVAGPPVLLHQPQNGGNRAFLLTGYPGRGEDTGAEKFIS